MDEDEADYVCALFLAFLLFGSRLMRKAVPSLVKLGHPCHLFFPLPSMDPPCLEEPDRSKWSRLPGSKVTYYSVRLRWSRSDDAKSDRLCNLSNPMHAEPSMTLDVCRVQLWYRLRCGQKKTIIFHDTVCIPRLICPVDPCAKANMNHES
jgi:hypothetical protein